jgi:hypothetical protein
MKVFLKRIATIAVLITVLLGPVPEQQGVTAASSGYVSCDESQV